MKNILLPTDFSENSSNAVAYALELFKKQECNFYLLNTYTPAIAHSRFMAETLRGSDLSENECKTSETGLQKTIESIRSMTNGSDHHFEAISSFDLLTHKVAETVKHKNIDLIVSGTKGATGYKQVFIGTNTLRMIKTVKDCPIIAVPEKYSFSTPKHVAFPTDFKHSFSADILGSLLKIAYRFGSEIHIVHINEDERMDKFQESNRSTLMEYLAPVSHNIRFMPHFSSKSNVIAKFLEEQEIDMLALVYNEHGYLDRLMREPVVANMAYHCKIPLLVLPN